jgi:hypothetical protein
MTDAVPVFVVVGNVNQGKSSIVAALAEDETVPIAPSPGTTVQSGEYAFEVGGAPIFRIVDTPGFQEARRTLAWLHAHCDSVASRRRTVEAFVAEHAPTGEFRDEVQLLRPILAGASVLYVVDASARFQPSSEAEMEILRWTGQPGMALLNRTRERDYAAEWRPILEQFFNVVREFNAHRAGFAERLALFRGFREVRDEWRAPMDRAIAAMKRDFAERRERAAAAIADFLVLAITHVERRRVGDGEDEAAVRADLQTRLAEALRARERDARLEVERIYGHRRIERKEGQLAPVDTDLFSEASWRLFGLTRTQLATQGALFGGAIGLAVDAMVGGASLLAGALAGAGIGAVGGYFGSTSIARSWNQRSRLAQALLPGETGRFQCVGPLTNPAFLWILVDRALVHARAIRDRSHARQDALDLAPRSAPGGDKQGVVASLDGAVRQALGEALRLVLKDALRGTATGEHRKTLATAVEQALAALPPSG